MKARGFLVQSEGKGMIKKKLILRLEASQNVTLSVGKISWVASYFGR